MIKIVEFCIIGLVLYVLAEYVVEHQNRLWDVYWWQKELFENFMEVME
jgi:hypothetical protein